MAINKKLIHFKTEAAFLREKEAGNILDTSIIFIQDAKKIVTHGWDVQGGYSDAEVDNMITGVVDDIQRVNGKIDKEVNRIDADIEALDLVKQGNLVAGFGINISDTNIISTTLDLSLLRIVPELPTKDIDPTKIYLIPDRDSESGNIYVEYIWVNDAWEVLGEYNSDIKIDDYLLISDFDQFHNDEFIPVKKLAENSVQYTEEENISLDGHNLVDVEGDSVLFSSDNNIELGNNNSSLMFVTNGGNIKTRVVDSETKLHKDENIAFLSDIPKVLPNPESLVLNYNNTELFNYDGTQPINVNLELSVDTIPGIHEAIQDTKDEIDVTTDKLREDIDNEHNRALEAETNINNILDYCVKFDETKKIITIPESGVLSGVFVGETIESGNITAFKKYGEDNVLEIGTTKTALALNSGVDHIQANMKNAEGDNITKHVAFEEDLNNRYDRIAILNITPEASEIEYDEDGEIYKINLVANSEVEKVFNKLKNNQSDIVVLKLNTNQYYTFSDINIDESIISMSSAEYTENILNKISVSLSEANGTITFNKYSLVEQEELDAVDTRVSSLEDTVRFYSILHISENGELTTEEKLENIQTIKVIEGANGDRVSITLSKNDSTELLYPTKYYPELIDNVSYINAIVLEADSCAKYHFNTSTGEYTKEILSLSQEYGDLVDRANDFEKYIHSFTKFIYLNDVDNTRNCATLNAIKNSGPFTLLYVVDNESLYTPTKWKFEPESRTEEISDKLLIEIIEINDTENTILSKDITVTLKSTTVTNKDYVLQLITV